MSGRALFAVTFLAAFCGTVSHAEPVKYTAAALRDPFAEQVQEKKVDETSVAEQKMKGLTVQGLLLSAKQPQAIISGKIYSVGSPIETVGRVTRIDKDGVTVSFQNKEILIQPTKRKIAHEPAKPKP